jgi:hypothetical protein
LLLFTGLEDRSLLTAALKSASHTKIFALCSFLLIFLVDLLLFSGRLSVVYQ